MSKLDWERARKRDIVRERGSANRDFSFLKHRAGKKKRKKKRRPLPPPPPGVVRLPRKVMNACFEAENRSLKPVDFLAYVVAQTGRSERSVKKWLLARYPSMAEEIGG